jgi:hypothetical protein
MPYPTEHSARLKDPSRYERFRRENDKFGPGIHAVWGITADGKAELQAIRFDVAKFSVAEAKAWLKEHGHKPILFEPASEKAEGSAESLAGQGEEFLVVEAASGEGPTGRIRVTGVAYSGGKMRLPGWRHPVVVDLAGLEVPDAVPLLTNHENRTGARVGMVKARVDGDRCWWSRGRFSPPAARPGESSSRPGPGRSGNSPSARRCWSGTWCARVASSTARSTRGRSTT